MKRYHLKFHPEFISELERAIDYYAQQSKIVGSRFKSATTKQLNLLKKNPYLMSIRYDDVRFARIGKFPYAIHYSIDIGNHRVLIHVLSCDHQDSEGLWRKRF